jgi:hypothetical protein
MVGQERNSRFGCEYNINYFDSIFIWLAGVKYNDLEGVPDNGRVPTSLYQFSSKRVLTLYSLTLYNWILPCIL